MNALEEVWFDAAERDSLIAEELAEAEGRAPDFIRLKVGLGCVLAALVMLVLPVLRSSAPAEPGPVAAVTKEPARPAVAAAPAKAPKAKAAKKAKKTPGKLVARK